MSSNMHEKAAVVGVKLDLLAPISLVTSVLLQSDIVSTPTALEGKLSAVVIPSDVSLAVMLQKSSVDTAQFLVRTSTGIIISVSSAVRDIVIFPVACIQAFSSS